MIAKRLREFLAVSADVDFAAKVTSRNEKMIFENPAYERKPGSGRCATALGRTRRPPPAPRRRPG